MSKDEQQAQNEYDLKEIADYYGGWEDLKKVIAKLEENEAEAAWERHCQEPGAWEGGFCSTH